jgi:hypothetical protein
MGEIARKAIEEMRRSAETRSPTSIYLEETREDFYRQLDERLRNIIPGFDPAAELRRRRRLRPLKRVPVDRHRVRSMDGPEGAPPQDSSPD